MSVMLYLMRLRTQLQDFAGNVLPLVHFITEALPG